MESLAADLKKQIKLLRHHPQDGQALHEFLDELDDFLDIHHTQTVKPPPAQKSLLLQQSIFNYLLDAVIITDMEFNIILWNEAAEKLYGWKESEVLGRRMLDVVPNYTPPDQVEMMQETLLTTGMWRGEIIQSHRDGTPIHILGSVVLLPEENKVLAVNRDITYLRETQNALHESEARFRGTFEQAAVGIAHIALDGSIMRANKRFEAIVGYSSAELEKMMIEDVIHPDDVAEDRSFRHALSNRQLSHITLEKRIHAKAHVELWVNMTYSLIESDHQAPPYFIAVIEDITERKLAEVALQHELLKNDLILRSTAEGICGFDTNGRIIFVNPSAEQMTGYNALEIMGNSLEVVGKIAFNQQIDSTILEEFAPYLTIKDGQPRHEPDAIFWRKDGTSFPVQYTVMPMVLGNLIQGAVLTFNDISLSKSLRENYLQLQAEQERAQVLQQFISDISHDFRTPLSTIGTSLYLLSQSHDPERQKRYISKAELQIQRLDTLLEDMLMMIKLDSDIDRHPTKINLNEVIQDIATALMSKAGQKEQSFFIDLHQAPLYVIADETHIYQAFLRILQNAIIYSPEGKMIHLTSKRDANNAMVIIKDHGIGIAESDLPFIFDRFYRVDKSRSTVGTSGLGLSIAKRAIENYQGQISVESTLGEGTSFYCHFPLHVDSLNA